MAKDDLLKCSFCGKNQKQVQKLVAGPGVYICNECIDLCNEIIEEEKPRPPVDKMPLTADEDASEPAEPGSHLVGVAEIADLLEVSRQRVAQLIATYADFPRPEAEIAAGRIYARAAVETWVAAHPERKPGRAPKAEPDAAAEVAAQDPSAAIGELANRVAELAAQVEALRGSAGTNDADA